jgi:hypothetical protein
MTRLLSCWVLLVGWCGASFWSASDSELAAAAAGDAIKEAFQERLKQQFENTETDQCRALITSKLKDYMLSEVKEHGSWSAEMGIESLQIPHAFTSQCPQKPEEDNTPKTPAEDIRIYYFITGHKYPKQIERIIKAVYNERHVFGLHFDGKSEPALISEMERIASTYSNVHLLPERYNITWGGFNMVGAMLSGIDDALRIMAEGTKIDFFINAAETAYPLKSDDFIRRHLSTYDPSGNYMGYAR